MRRTPMLFALVTAVSVSAIPVAAASEPRCLIVTASDKCIPDPSGDSCDQWPSKPLDRLSCVIGETVRDARAADVQCDSEPSFIDMTVCAVENLDPWP